MTSTQLSRSTSFALTISPDYVPTWGVWEGMRELIQNALDADQDGHDYTVETFTSAAAVASDSGLLSVVIGSDNVKLDPNVWLLGKTSKSGGGYRGVFGEGLALGILALVRGGYDVQIHNANELWTPVIQQSELFNERVLTINVAPDPSPSPHFRVIVHGLNGEDWAMVKERFLALTPAAKFIHAGETEILQDPQHAGKLFVKGIFVQDSADHALGYNFLAGVDTDRDRGMVSSWDAGSASSRAWGCALSEDSTLATTVLDLLMNTGAYNSTHRTSGAYEDVDRLQWTYFFNDRTMRALAKAWKAGYGDDAVPMGHGGEEQKALHCGKVPIPCRHAAHQVLSKIPELSLAAALKAYNNHVEARVALTKLSCNERAVLNKALNCIDPVALELQFPAIREHLHVVTFKSPEVHGQYDNTGDRMIIRLARTCLRDLAHTIEVLVHELAHCMGADGDVRHQRAEGRLYSHVIARQLQQRLRP